MQVASHAFLLFLAVLLGLWPVALVATLLRHALARRWWRVGQAALLLPLWTTAASVGLTQVVPFIAALDAQAPVRSPFIAVAAIACTLFFACLAWGLLVASLGSARGPGTERASAP